MSETASSILTFALRSSKEGERGRNATEIWVENLPNIMNEVKLRKHRVPNEINLKDSHQHIIIKLSKVKE